MHQTFHIATKAVIVHNNKVLLLKELDSKDSAKERYDLPGGRVEPNETFEEALQRELQEELGITEFEIKNFLLATQHPYYDRDGVKLVLLNYLVEVAHPAITLSEEHTSYEWITKEQCLEMQHGETYMHDGIRLALAKSFYS